MAPRMRARSELRPSIRIWLSHLTWTPPRTSSWGANFSDPAFWDGSASWTSPGWIAKPAKPWRGWA